MTPQRWREVKALLAEALERQGEERAALLAAADPGLARDVEAFLALDAEIGDFIERPVFDLHDRDDPAVRVGERLGPYRLVGVLGVGGMGTVYRGVRADDEFEQAVAVKVLKRGLDTAEVVHRFRTERQILANLEHPHVARLIDGGTTADGRPYLVMEYVEGRPIDRWCDERGLGVEARLALFAGVCDAVGFAHRNLVVHRDLKPSNILVGDDGTPKLLDFGIARLLDPERAGTLPTVGAWRFWTPEYASPEQLFGWPITTATDVYSLGVLLYLLLTGRPPYELGERSASALATALERGAPARPSAVAPPERRRRLRGDLDAIALMALRREPERRYGSAGELADDLRRHLDGLPVRAAPDSWRYRAGKFVKRHRVAVAAAAAIALLLVAFAITASVLTGRAIDARRVAEAETQRAEAERVRAEETLRFLENLISEADPDRKPGGEPTVRELLDEAASELSAEGEHDATGIRDPAVRAALLQTIGRAYLSVGAVDEAQKALEEALRIRSSLLGESDPALVETLSTLAKAYLEQDDDETAERLLLRAIEIERANQPTNNPDLLSGLHNLAQINERRGEYALCAKRHREILEIRRREEAESLAVASSLHNLANCLLSDRRTAAAEPYLLEALELRERLQAEPKAVARTLNSLANVAEAQGDPGLAEERYAAAESLLTDHDPRHPGLPSVLSNLSLLRQEQGEVEAAEETIRRALAISDYRNPDNPDRWYFVRNLVAILVDRSELPEARSLLVELRRAFDEKQNLDAWRRADLDSLRGGLLVAEGRWSQAEPLLLTSYESLLAADPPAHPRNVRQAHHRIVRLYEAWGKEEAAAEWRARPPAPGDAG